MRVFLYVLIFVLLIPAALILGISLILTNPDLYRDQVTETFQSETGLELQIKGDIGWRFWPLIALNVNDLEIHSPGTDVPLAQLQSAAIDLELLPLLFGHDKITIDSIFIDGLKVNLEVNEHGRANWETNATERTPADQASGEGAGQTENTFNLDIAQIEIYSAEIDYRDKSAKQHYRVDVTSASTGPISHDQPVNVQAKFFIEDKIASTTSRTEASGQVSVNRGFDRFTFSEMHFNNVVNIPDLPELRPDAVISGNFDTQSGAMKLEETTVTLNNSTLKGNVTLSLQEKTRIEFDFNLDRLNTNDYLPPATEADGEGRNDGSSGQVADFEVIPSTMLNDYVIGGRMQIDEFQYDIYKFAPAELILNNKQQKLTVEFTGQAYEGHINITLAANTGTQTTGELKVNMTDLNVTQLTEWEWVTGTFNADSTTRFKGRMMSEILNSIDGPTNFTINDGELDVTPIKALATVIDSIRGKTTSKISGWPDRMPFERLRGSHKFTNGAAENQIFSFELENLKVAGTGGYDYWQDRVDYDIQVTLEETDSGQFQVNPRLADITWPLHCEGRLDQSPVDLCLANADAVTQVAKQALKREAEKKAVEKIEEELGEGARKLLDGFLKR